MHITILAHGSRGDVQPYMALGLGLKQSGHSVRLAAPELFRGFVADYGLEFAPLAGDPRILMRSVVEDAGGRSGLLRAASVVLKYAASIALDVIHDARQACQGTEAIIHSLLMTTVGHEIALQMGVPDFSALVFAVFSPTAAFPNPAFRDLPLGGWYNRLTHRLFAQVYWHGGRLAYNWVTRGKRDHYPPLSGWPFAPSNGWITPILYGFSPAVLPKPPDWGEHAHVPGFWFLPAADPGPPELARFLEAGSPPVCISFGSIIARDAERLTGLALEALARSGQRGVLVTGWGGLAGADLPGQVFAVESVPFDWLFPRVAAAVIHGGIGTTAAAMQAGIPAVVVPFTLDQHFWGERAHCLGVAPEPIPHQKLTAGRLAEAIGMAVDDAPMRQRARQLGQTLRAENGVLNAVRVIEGYLDSAYPGQQGTRNAA
jgi:sterol 3beta-glucosyltransferase